jgi:hypothetical protein
MGSPGRGRLLLMSIGSVSSNLPSGTSGLAKGDEVSTPWAELDKAWCRLPLQVQAASEKDVHVEGILVDPFHGVHPLGWVTFIRLL